MREPDHADERARLDVEALYREHAAPLYAWACLRLEPRLRRVCTPEDLTQEIWLRAARLAATRDQHSGPPRAWLFTIAKHVLFEVHRAARQRVPEGAGSSTRLSLLQEVPAEVTSLTQRLARDDNVRAFLERATALDDDDRALLLHVGLEAMSQAEVAVQLGVGYEALAKRWQRLRDRVRTWPSAQALLTS